MKTYLDCIPCFINQALRAARIATADETKIKRVLDETGSMIKSIPIQSTPPESGRLVYHKVNEITGCLDPFRKIKNESTQKALSLYPILKKKVQKSRDRLLMAIKIAVAGNVIDYGANWEFDLEQEVENVINKHFAISDYELFKNCLDKTLEILYLADNAGECVFDRILIEELKKPVIYAVRALPIINDATHEDALQAGIDRVATIISSGTDAPGTVLGTCSPEFKKIYYHATFIISKGQGNYEALSSQKDRPLFFLLKAKCGVIAGDLGVKKDDIVLMGL